MKKLEKIAGDDGRVLGAQVHERPTWAGLISRITLGVLGLIRSERRKATAEKAAATRKRGDAIPGAQRSAIDAGITGGISLLTAGQTDRNRRI